MVRGQPSESRYAPTAQAHDKAHPVIIESVVSEENERPHESATHIGGTIASDRVPGARIGAARASVPIQTMTYQSSYNGATNFT